jgi:hypothetical protein
MGPPPRTTTAAPGPRAFETTALVAASACALVYAGLSLLYAKRWPGTAELTDAYLRWQEIRYVFKGVDPRDVVLGTVPVDPAVGRPRFTYPPWSYVLGSAVIPPITSRHAIAWFVAVNVAGLALMAAHAARLGTPFGRRARLLVPLSALATIAVPITLRHLNYSIVVCAALAAFVHYAEKGAPLRAGAALAFASLKPQLGALFFLVPLFRRSWSTLLVGGALNVAAALAAAAMLSKSPLALVTAMAEEGASYADAYLGMFDLLRRFGVPNSTVLLMGMVVGVVGASAVLHLFRDRPLRTLVGVVACFTTLWTYQRTMDLLILGFLVGPLAVRAYRSRRTRDWTVFVVVGASYWFPYLVRMAATPVVPEVFRAVWIFGAVHLLRREDAPSLVPALTRPAPRPESAHAPSSP